MYETYFRLRELPFNLTPDPRFFYANASHREAFATLSYGVEQRKGIIVITGEAGTGKTVLLRRFVQNAGANIQLYYVVDPHLTFIELLRCAADVFGLPQRQDRLVMLQQLKEYLIEQLEKDHRVALLFDEAQDLNEEVLGDLRLLSDWESRGENLLQIVLVGHLDLENRLANPSFKELKQRIALRSRMAPLSQEDVCPYIQSRLSAAGYAGGTLFATSAIERIALHSRGVPRLINLLCDNALLIACATSQKEVAAEIIEEVAGELQIQGLTHDQSTALKWSGPQYTATQEISGANREAAGEYRWVFENQNSSLRDLAWTLDRENTLETSGETHKSRLQGSRKPRQHLTAWLIVVFGLGVMTLVLYRQQSTIELSSITRPVEKIKEVIAPIPGWIQRILAMDGLYENTTGENSVVQSTRIEEHTFPNLEFSQNLENVAITVKGGAGITDETRYKNKEALNLEKTDRNASPKTSANAVKQTSIQPRRQAKTTMFVVFEKSFVRGEPTANAEIIATLSRGARVQVVSKKGEYWRIRSLGPEPINGYVHQEDAFFEPSR